MTESESNRETITRFEDAIRECKCTKCMPFDMCGHCNMGTLRILEIQNGELLKMLKIASGGLVVIATPDPILSTVSLRSSALDYLDELRIRGCFVSIAGMKMPKFKTKDDQ